MCDDFDEYIVRFKYKSEVRNIYIKRDALTLDNLLNFVFAAFQINVREKVNVNLTDNFNIRIPKNKVLQHVKAFWRSDSFYLNLSYEGATKYTVDIVTPQIIEDYMKEKDQRTLLSDCKGQITMEVRSRHKIIQIAVDFMMDQFGEDVNMFERQMTARALVKLFPFLGALEGQNIGIRTLINGSNSGWLNARYYHVRATKRKQEEAERSISSLNTTTDKGDPQEDVNFLKTLIVIPENLELFKDKLNATRTYRTKMMEKDEVEFKEHFPYFFTHPLELISLEFGEKYKGENSQVQPNGLIDNWFEYSKQLTDVLTVQHKKTPYETEWSSEIESILLILQLFPSKQVGRNVIATSKNFETSVGKLIHFEMTYTPPNEMAPSSKSYPAIIACGNSKTEIDYFCLKVENKIIPLPENLDFLHVIDLFFKVHKIFNLNYDPHLHNMMVFIENFIYKVKGEHQPTNRMQDISRYFERPILAA